MNDGGSIVEFFYNIVPGSLFLALLEYYRIFSLSSFIVSSKDKEGGIALLIFAYIVLGLFLGFVFQTFTKFFRDRLKLNESISKKVIEKNKAEFNLIYKTLRKNYKNKEELTNEKAFYLMDNYLRGERPAFLPTHNSSRFAFWSNIFFASSILMVLILIKNSYLTLGHLIFVPVIIFSAYQAYMYFYAYYDTILKSYYMKTEYKNGV